MLLALLLTAAPSYPRTQDASQKPAQLPAATTTQAVDNSETKLPPKAHSFAPYAERAATERLNIDVITEAQDDGTQYFYQGINQYEAQHLTKAAEAFKQAVALRPEWAAPRHSLATMYGELGIYDEAIKEFRETLKLEMESTQEPLMLEIERTRRLVTLYNMGNVCLDAGRFEEAASTYQEINRERPMAPLVHYNMGLAYVGLGQKEKAAEEFRTAASLPHRSNDSKAQAKAHFNLGVARLQIGQRDLAAAEVKELQSLHEANLAKRLSELLQH